MNFNDERRPAFAVGERVIDINRERVGTVIKTYILGGVYRYFVRFDDGSEQGFYRMELELKNEKPWP